MNAELAELRQQLAVEQRTRASAERVAQHQQMLTMDTEDELAALKRKVARVDELETELAEAQAMAQAATEAMSSAIDEMEADLAEARAMAESASETMSGAYAEIERLEEELRAAQDALETAGPTAAEADTHAKLRFQLEALARRLRETTRERDEQVALVKRATADQAAATAAAEREAERLQRELSAARAELDAERDRLQGELDAERGRLQVELGAAAEGAATHQQLQADNERLSRELSIAREQLAADRELLTSDRDRLASDRDQLASDAAATRERLEAEAARLQATNERLREELAGARQALAEAPPSEDVAAARALEAQVATLQQQLETANGARNRLRAEARRLSEALREAKAQATSGPSPDDLAAMESLRQHHQSLQVELRAARAERDGLEAEVARLEHVAGAEVARVEKAFEAERKELRRTHLRETDRLTDAAQNEMERIHDELQELAYERLQLARQLESERRQARETVTAERQRYEARIDDLETALASAKALADEAIHPGAAPPRPLDNLRARSSGIRRRPKRSDAPAQEDIDALTVDVAALRDVFKTGNGGEIEQAARRIHAESRKRGVMRIGDLAAHIELAASGGDMVAAARLFDRLLAAVTQLHRAAPAADAH